jgi:predicted ATPase
MRIKSIDINNFKSLDRFHLDVPKFCCLVGLNGTGKSTVLQCLDFLAQLARGDLEGWLRRRHWRHGEVLSRVRRPRRLGEQRPQNSRTVSFKVRAIDVQRRQEVVWTGTYNPYELRCTAESITTNAAELTVRGGQLSISTFAGVFEDGSGGVPSETAQAIAFTYQGSVLSQLREESLPPSLAEFQRFLRRTDSLDMLSPEHLRQRTREAGGSLGHGGRNLSAFIHELSDSDREQLTVELQKAYPQLTTINSRAIQSGWKELWVGESYGVGLATASRHMNDGMLRLMAIISELRSDHGLLLFDEIENGINPELVKFVVSSLVNARQQIVATTHSPLILNYLDDEVARESVILLYKTPAGDTQAVRLFDIPSLSEKLSVMGPGEAFVDTDLVALSAEASRTKAEA